MNTTQDGGPAFPQHGWSSNPEVIERMKGQRGMSLRDWMAGMALSGMLANPEYAGASDSSMAEYSYKQADAMLAARERKEDA